MSQPMTLSDTGCAKGNSNRPEGRDFTNHYDRNHPRSPKRRYRRQQQPAVIRDCYQEATSATPKLRHDWFLEIPQIRKDRHDELYHRGPSAQLLADLESRDSQLQHVKRQFRPASERCAVLCRTTPEIEFDRARRACNPYEPLGESRAGGLNHGLFLNRSAIKLANMDAALRFALTTTTTTPDAFYFVDLCAAPGGFSEYLLRRCGHSITTPGPNHAAPVTCRGYGMSLVGQNAQGKGTPWKLTPGPQLLGGSGPGVYYQICEGQDGTGDILQWANVDCLRRKIALAQGAAPEPRVALVCADGGVDAQRNREHPEGETAKLVVCQVAAALSLLQPTGRLVVKLLACRSTPVLPRLMQVLYDSFDSLQVLKPVSSRPASAERYLVCSGFQRPSVEVGPAWIDHILAADQPVAPELLAFLARVDLDMMELNLKACRAILLHMQSKIERLATPMPTAMTASIMGGDDDMEEEKGEDDAWIAQGYQHYHSFLENKRNRKKKVNLNSYKKAWRLF